jgi:ATP-dependent Clp protease ATP-binding subunit ClpX
LHAFSAYAFVGLDDFIAQRLGRGGFGFGQLSEISQVASEGLLRLVKPEDLEQFGLILESVKQSLAQKWAPLSS